MCDCVRTVCFGKMKSVNPIIAICVAFVFVFGVFLCFKNWPNRVIASYTNNNTSEQTKQKQKHSNIDEQLFNFWLELI